MNDSNPYNSKTLKKNVIKKGNLLIQNFIILRNRIICISQGSVVGFFGTHNLTLDSYYDVEVVKMFLDCSTSSKVKLL